jgi:hypothetical protein
LNVWHRRSGFIGAVGLLVNPGEIKFGVVGNK